MSDQGDDSKITKGLQDAKDKLSEKMVQLAHKESQGTAQETIYNVVFTGKFTKNEKQTIAAMAKFFKQGQEATKRLLQPGRVIKNFPTKAPADKLLRMLANVGLECKVEMEIVGEEEEATLLEKAAFKLDEAKIPQISIPNPKNFSKNQKIGSAAVLVVLIGLITWLVLKPPVVKGDSFASFEASVQKVMDRTPDEEKEALQKAINLLTGAGFEYQKENTFGGNEEVAANMAYGAIKGLTAKGIMTAAEKELERKRQWYRDEITATQQQIKDDKATIAELGPENAELDKLKISEERFYWIKGNAPQIDFKLTNQSQEDIHRVFFQGYLYDENGGLLVTKGFSFTVAVGLKPGKSKYVPLYTKAGDIWADQRAKKNWRKVKFKATVELAENTDYQSIGVDLRPERAKVAAGHKRIKDLEKQLANINL